MDIITRKQARNQQLKFYFTGKPCKFGHIAPRRTSSSVCVDCDAIHRERHHDVHLKRSKRWRENNKERDSTYHKEWYQRNAEHRKQMFKQWKQENAEHYSIQQKAYYQRTKKARQYYHKKRWIQIRDEAIKAFQLVAPQVRLDEAMSGESRFKWFCAGILICALNSTVIKEYYINDESRIDLYVPDYQLGVEVKLPYPYWNADSVEEQRARYNKALGEDHQVIVVSPNGEFGYSVEELTTFVQTLLD